MSPLLRLKTKLVKDLAKLQKQSNEKSGKTISIKNKLNFIFLISSIIPLSIISIIAYNIEHQTILEKTHNQMISEAYQRSIAIEKINQLRIEQLKSISTTDEIQNFIHKYNTIEPDKIFDKNTLRDEKEKLRKELFKFNEATGKENGFNNIKIIDTNGAVIFSSNESLQGRDYSKDKFFTSGLKEPFRTIILEDGERRAQVVVPIYDDSIADSKVLLGVIMADTRPYLTDQVLLNRNGLGDTGESYLVNSDMVLITPSKFVDGVFKQEVNTPPVRECFENKSNTEKIHSQYMRGSGTGLEKFINAQDSGSYSDYRGVPVIGVSMCAQKYGYVLLVEIDQQEMFAPLVILQEQFIIAFLVLAISIVITSTSISKYITKPITQLDNAVNNITLDNLDTPITSITNDEIGRLAKKFDKMREHVKFVTYNLQEIVNQKTRQIKEANNELTENNIRMIEYVREISKIKKALDEASLFAITDKNGTIIEVNQKFCDVSKYSKEELIGQNHRILKSGYHPPEFYKGIWHAISHGHTWRGDIKNKAKDGTFYWVRTVIFPILDQQKKPVEYISVRTDITNQKRIEENLKDALYEIQEIDKLKDEFESMVSHELRTPLIPIMGYCEMLMNPNISGSMTETHLESIREIYKNSKKLRRMIEDVLTAQKLDMNHVKFEKKDTSLVPFIKSIHAASVFSAKEKNIEFVSNLCVDQIIKTDPDRLSQVFDNLIQNSIDFTYQNGKIEIGATSQDGNILFYVKDNGIGIQKDKQDKIFKKFYQIDTSIKRQHGGTGLGLVICKGIVEGLGGRIWFESEYGRGTTFYFTIPKDLVRF